ncbi:MULTISPECIES: response regulator [Corallococcus]|uniref:response regulator n=1 Tax=Corallococcus TaxID=83461 RepID=UPI0018762FBB|nr:response regulator transcription factor [Corallococcus sp. BB11-1]MCY1032782.1 response regulator transcription factor [Corallococcus sp. BB11-1]
MERTRIFVVEDQPQLLRNLVKVLNTFPELELVGTSQDGEQAVEDIVRERPQLVLLDLELPSMHGIQVTQKVKRRAPEVEILILTSFEEEQKVYEAIQAGASGYLVKRVGPEKIRSAIQEVMEGGTVLEPLIARRFWNYFQSVQAKPAQKSAELPWGLTALELDVLRYVAKGLSNAEVGQVMTLERRTVRTHLSHIYRKMGVNSHVDAVVMALREGVVDL